MRRLKQRMAKGLVILSGVLLSAPLLAGVREETRTRSARARLELLTLEAGLRRYQVRHGNFPSQEEGLEALFPEQVDRAELTDPWGKPYGYVVRNRVVLVYTLGEDQREGGQGESVDLYSPWLAPRSSVGRRGGRL